jgi:hypothetical protein
MVPMYIKARYPEQKVAAAKSLNEQICRTIIDKTKQLTQWIEELLRNSRLSKSSESTNE